MNLFARAKSLFGFGRTEGSVVPAFGMGELGSWFRLNDLDGTGWQRNLTTHGDGARHVAPVYACVMLYCRAVSQCTAQHMVGTKGKSDEKSTTSPASRVLRYPNGYETWTNFVYNLVAEMLFRGESLCLKVRDDRNAVIGLHRVPHGNWSIHIEPETKEVFYGIGNGELFARPEMLVPQREVAHFRTHTPRHPLIGESPITAAAMAIGVNVALNASQLAFFNQMSRPSGVISTDMQLTADQMRQLRAAFDEQSKGWSQGKVPILANGMKWTAVNISQADSQLIEQQRLSTVDVARVFGVPMALLAENSGGTQSGTEAMISNWLSIGLGSMIENIERTLDRAFDLSASDHIQLDPTPLLRVDFAGRIDGLTKAVQGGLLTPNEARAKEGFGELKGGNDGFMQQQMVPITLLNELHAAAVAAKVSGQQSNQPEPEEPEEPEDEKEPDLEVGKALVVSMQKYKRKAA